MTGPLPSRRGPSHRGAVIFDRDGVLNVDVHYAHRPDQIVWIEGAIAAVRAVNDAGLYAFVATNQAGVARGLYGEAEVEALHAWMQGELARAGARIDAFAYCPHHPDGTVDRYRTACERRKPGPGMIRDLLAAHDADPERSLMIGDRDSDMAAAKAAGVEGLLFTGGSLLEALQPHLNHLSQPNPLSSRTARKR